MKKAAANTEDTLKGSSGQNGQTKKPNAIRSRKSGDAGSREHRLSPAADLAPDLHSWTLVSVSLGHDERAYVLLIDEEPQRQEGFAAAGLKQTVRYKALTVELHGSQVRETIIEGENFNYHYLQPLGDDLLLVGARCTYYGRDRYDLNAAVFNREGQPLRRFLLGDGIQNVQTTAGGLIWTSFFDEGVFGNYGWSRPVGESGLIAWDSAGIRVFTNSEADIADCYALNVVSDEEVWFYYYTNFKLCRLSGPAAQPKVSFLDPQLAGSAVFAVHGGRVLLDNGYGKHDEYTLMQQSAESLIHMETLIFTDPDGRRLESPRSDARGAKLLLMEDMKLYLFSLEEHPNGTQS
ncbi:hypothetical protein [Saccharibacillus qingshengii]|uniref:hypothetical protein n=1 Tax=Saccharibacillus qingshengii TaxID=1763540 RepID=UPI001551A4B0|nr:hypothetical protein [Saccharibacillus qingshengii]